MLKIGLDVVMEKSYLLKRNQLIFRDPTVSQHSLG